MITNIFNNKYLSYDSQYASTFAIDAILNKGNKWPYYTAEDIIQWNQNIMNQDWIETDPGENRFKLNNRWIPEDEPLSVPMDPTARLSVKTEVIVRQDKNDNSFNTKSDRSSMSMKSSSLSKKIGSAIRLMNSSALSKNNSQKKINEQSQILYTEPIIKFIEEDEHDIKKKELLAPDPDPIIEKIRENKEKIDKEKQIEIERKRKKQLEEKAMEEKRLENQKLLKNKSYTYDYDCQIVVLKPMVKQDELQESDLIQLGIKNPNKKPPEIVKPVSALVKKQEQVNIVENFKKKKVKLAQVQPQEFPKQPPHIEIVNPKAGVKIQFSNGYKKDGGPNKQDNRMSKEEYQKIVEDLPNRPVPQYLQVIQEQKVIEESEMQKKIKLLVQQQNKRPKTAQANQQYYEMQGVQIKDQQQFSKMMEDEIPVQKLISSVISSYVGLSKTSQDYNQVTKDDNQKNQDDEQQQKKKKDKMQAKLERITAYKKKQFGPKGIIQEIKYDLGINYDATNREESKPDVIMPTKVHQKVKEFDQQILENNNWGADMGSQYNLGRSQIPQYKIRKTQNSQTTKSIINTKLTTNATAKDIQLNDSKEEKNKGKRPISSKRK